MQKSEHRCKRRISEGKRARTDERRRRARGQDSENISDPKTSVIQLCCSRHGTGLAQSTPFRRDGMHLQSKGHLASRRELSRRCFSGSVFGTFQLHWPVRHLTPNNVPALKRSSERGWPATGSKGCAHPPEASGLPRTKYYSGAAPTINSSSANPELTMRTYLVEVYAE